MCVYRNTMARVLWPLIEDTLSASDFYEPLHSELFEAVAASIRAGQTPDVAALAYLEDPSAAMARKFGVSRDEFCEWFATDGGLACEGALVNGASCRVLIGPQLPIEIWKKAKVEGGYCRRHAGVLASGH